MTETRCVNDTNGDGDCAACARNPNAPCRQPMVDQEALTAAHLAVESVLFDASGRHVSRVVSTREGLEIGIRAYLAAVGAADPYAHLTDDERQTLAVKARDMARSIALTAGLLDEARFNAAIERSKRWQAIADELKSTDG